MRFAGYAALFDVRDRGGDTIRAGAFAGLSAPLPLLWQHDPTRQIGMIDRAEEDARGLYVEGQITEHSGTAQNVAAMVTSGALSGLSFGYRVRAYQNGPAARAGRETRDLLRVDVAEVSIVSQPMQPGARVTRVADG